MIRFLTGYEPRPLHNLENSLYLSNLCYHTYCQQCLPTLHLCPTLSRRLSPKLDPTGLNWAIFRVRFRDAVEVKGFWAHFDGSSKRPEAAPTAEGKPPGPTTKELTAMSRWDKDELSAKSLLTQKIPDSTLMRIHAKITVRERWEAIVKEYTEKGAYAQTDLVRGSWRRSAPRRRMSASSLTICASSVRS